MKNRNKNSQIFERAASCARLNRPTALHSCARLKGELKDALRQINSTFRLIERRFGAAQEVPEACQWLLDNRYIALREGKAALGDIARAGKMRSGVEGELLPVMCRDMLSALGMRLTAERMREYLHGYQSVCPLTHAELALFPAVLRSQLLSALAEHCRKLSASSSPDSLTDGFAALFSSLRAMAELDQRAFLRSADLAEAELMADPAGVYPRMDDESRDSYRARLSRLAAKSGLEEHVFARQLIEKCREGEGAQRHVGYYLLPAPDERRRSGAYIGLNVILTLFLTLLCGFSAHSAATALLLLLPASELIKTLLDYIITLAVPPRRLPRIKITDGVPDDGRTVCVISALLSSAEDTAYFARRLEEFSLANRDCGKNLLFGILADLPEADCECLSEDGDIIRSAAEHIDALNEKYGGGFYLFTRPRTLDSGRGRYSGFERKRGALLALARLMSGGKSELKVAAGDPEALRGARFIITLDSDTSPTPGSLSELIGAMLHPMNTPVLDTLRGCVTAGHGIIHPRMSTTLASCGKTGFSRVFAGRGGCDAYASPCGEVFMDLFDRGGFSGKGIIDAASLVICSKAHIPDGRVLSHDALEGAFLRGGYMSDTEFSDSFPASPLAYYRRSHRWLRGDWQNSPWIFDAALPDIERWRLFDSLRRSMIAPATFTAIFLGLLLGVSWLRAAAWAAVLALGSGLLISLTELASSKPDALTVRYHSRVLGGMGSALVMTLLRLWLLPYEAWVSFSAAATAVWRMAVSEKNLLEWQTAAQGDERRFGAFGYIANMWPCIAAGLALVAFASGISAKTAGLFWIAAPLAAAALALPARRSADISDADRKYLTDCAREIWSYFERFCTAEDNFLPPDNFQEQPPVGIAHRTSPTNIGLALMSAMCAQRLGIISSERAADFVGNMLDSVERLTKFRGHLCNWYDTRTLRPLEPRYLSTVDCGNLYACMAAAGAMLGAIGEMQLAQRLDTLMQPMDLSVFYDDERSLFYIGIDLDKGTPSPGLYDLMASEAQLTSYAAVAKGDVPRRHWRKLSRVMRQYGGYRGMVSWTGTMFEYLMPTLFLPLTAGSLLYETAKLCVFVQKRRRSRSGLWGISESAFFSLDPALNYRYKAHGCAALALKRGQDKELVIAPYATFLALGLDFNGAMRNLRRLDSQGARGKFGFIEAIDFTPSRCRSDGGERVRCFMVHHLGMSLLAITNALCGGVQEAFMSISEMSAHRALLEEKIPYGAQILPSDDEKAEKPDAFMQHQWESRGSGVNYAQPSCVLLSNGAYNIMLTESGLARATCREMLVYTAPFHSLDLENSARMSLVSGKYELPLLPYPSSENEYMWEFSEISCTFSCVCESFESRCTIAVSGSENGEMREVEICAREDIQNAQLVFTFEPVLANADDYVNHKAYWRLGIEAKNESNCLMLHRLARSRQEEVWLCVACDRDITARASEISLDGALSAPFVSVAARLSLKASERTRLRFSLCAADSPEGAYSGAQHMLAQGPEEYGAMVPACASLTHMNAAEVGKAMSLLGKLLFVSAARPFPAKSELWRYGISGDLPIICCPQEEDIEAVTRRFCLLRACGVYADLVFFTDEGGEYCRPVYSKVRDTLAAHGLEALLGTHAGVRILPTEAQPLVSSAAACIIGAEERRRTFSAPPRTVKCNRRGIGAVIKHEYCESGSFVFYVNQILPSRVWSTMLTNGRMGYIAADTGMGNMWFQNAREMRLTPWENEPDTVSGPESLELVTDNSRHSLFAAADGASCRVKFGCGCAVWEKSLGSSATRCTAFVPPDIDARVFIIELFGELSGSIEWKCELLLAENENDHTAVSVNYVNSVFTASSSRSAIEGLKFRAMCSAPVLGYTCDLLSWSYGEFDERTSDLSYPVFAARLEAQSVIVLVCGCAQEDELLQLCKPETAFSALERTRAHWLKICTALTLTGCGAADNYMNGWAVYQTLACRLMGRCSMYQSGGAVGFRDQLQDAVNLILIDASLARSHILSACRHQYLEGDVMHWWHSTAGSDKGVRTRCSDDLLWLVWALCEYTEKTGDFEICECREYYVNSAPLEAHERDRYETPARSDCSESVLEHACRAIDLCIARGRGEHGLLLFGSGDWNDGLDNIGGESVWLSWFFACCVRRFSELLMSLCKPNSEKYRALAAEIGQAADSAWDGERYLRGFWPDGAPLGSKSCGECRIDSIAQSWACFCAEAQNSRADTALDSALRLLFDRERKIIKLFDPPFCGGGRDPGYIRSYGAGFRENGGQYTHAALWLAMACLRRGRADDAWEILCALLPENHDLREYLAEPFVLAADVCTAAGHEGEAGWTWYTGSSGWYFRVFAEELLGLRLWHGGLYIRPTLPEGFPDCRITLRPLGKTPLKICIGADGIFVNGEKYDGKNIPYA